MVPKADDRHERLGFNCQCTACVNDYSKLSALKHGAIPFPEDIQFYPEFQIGRQIDRSIALNTNYGVAEYLQRYGNQQPCKELVVANVSFLKILNELYCKETSVTWKVYRETEFMKSCMKLGVEALARLPNPSEHIRIFVDHAE